MLIAILAAITWFWMDSLSKRERAILLGRELVARLNLQFLDESVACTNIWFGRNRHGHVQLLRTYAFEVSPDGTERLPCRLILLGNQLSSWHIPPYLQPL